MLNNNKDELDKFVKDKNNETYKVILYKDDLSCLIQQVKEEKAISENVYKLLVDGKSEYNSICLMVYFRIAVQNGTGHSQPYIQYEYSAFSNKENKDDSLLILDTLVSFSEFASFIKTWLNQHDNLYEELYKEMPDFLWFFKVFLTTQHENYFEPNFD